jgi:hypothetical protein
MERTVGVKRWAIDIVAEMRSKNSQERLGAYRARCSRRKQLGVLKARPAGPVARAQ